MSVQTIRNEIDSAAAELQTNWHAVQQVWLDSNRQRFEHMYLQPIEYDVRRVEAELDRLIELLNRAERECP